MFKIYQKYIAFIFIKKLFIVTTIFFTLVLLLGVLEEINFFRNKENIFLLPYFLNILNAPITLFEIFPFIFVLTVILFFNEIFEKDEATLLKKSGISNLTIIKNLFFFSIIIGILNIVFFYNFASNLKYHYSNIKNKFSSDNKYLAMVNESGLWIKDEVDGNVLITRAKKIDKNLILDVVINEFDVNHNLVKTILADKIDINSNNWLIYKPLIIKDNVKNVNLNNIEIKTNFNENKINSLFSDISTLNLKKLYSLKRDYERLGYSSNEMKLHFFKLISMPIVYSLLTVISCIIMLNLKNKKNLIFYIATGILISVIIYYINFIFFSLGSSGKISAIISIFFPLTILGLIALIGLININEK